MSGPKGACYRVVSQAELEHRALVQAMARMEAVSARAQALASETEATRELYGAQISPFVRPPDFKARDAASYRAEADALEHRLAEAENRFQREVSAARAEKLAAARALRRTTTPPATNVQAKRSDPAEGAIPDPVDDLLGRVTAALGRLATSDETARAQIEAAAGEVLSAEGGPRAQLLYRALQDHVQRANSAEQGRVLRRMSARKLRAELLGLSGERIDPLLARLAALEQSGEQLDEDQLRREVELNVEEANAEADRAVALQTAVQCLQDLGYEVSPGFETAVVSGGVMHLRRGTFPGYAVQLRVTDRPELGFNVVRDMRLAANPGRDAEVETAWCADFDELQERAALRGVELALTRSSSPGQLPVQQVDLGPREQNAVSSREQRRRSARPLP